MGNIRHEDIAEIMALLGLSDDQGRTIVQKLESMENEIRKWRDELERLRAEQKTTATMLEVCGGDMERAIGLCNAIGSVKDSGTPLEPRHFAVDALYGLMRRRAAEEERVKELHDIVEGMEKDMLRQNEKMRVDLEKSINRTKRIRKLEQLLADRLISDRYEQEAEDGC